MSTQTQIDLTEARDLCKLSKRTPIRIACVSGKIKSEKKGRSWVLDKASLLAWNNKRILEAKNKSGPSNHTPPPKKDVKAPTQTVKKTTKTTKKATVPNGNSKKITQNKTTKKVAKKATGKTAGGKNAKTVKQTKAAVAKAKSKGGIDIETGTGDKKQMDRINKKLKANQDKPKTTKKKGSPKVVNTPHIA